MKYSFPALFCIIYGSAAECNFPQWLFAWGLVRQHLYSLSDDNNLLLVPCWWWEVVQKGEKVWKYFVLDCLKKFSITFYLLKLHKNSKNHQFSVKKKVKPLHKYYPVAIGMAFSSKFVLDAKMQNIAFWIIPIKSFFRDLVALNVNFQGEQVFKALKSTENVNSKGSGLSYKQNCFFPLTILDIIL